ncbi:hypothetical protein [Ramlibacter sp.]|uniref:hypothetical protein n=1 Tax=Ramlibacter sp. TaxID=1917967 RepID=UPI0017C8A2FA|nr:hypothetical protein [Ramlibacter sp.]MBA2673080.1 hypothetical protein [Ramlibacter sp.]
MKFLLSLGLSALLLAGCASPFGISSIAPGASRDQVIAQAGQPTGVVPLPGGGERLQYSLQPMGRFAWMVDLDASGRVVNARQALTDLNFQRIQPGWTRADVEREFGPPALIDRVASWSGPVMTYRWRDTDRSDMFYWVYLDGQGVVRRAHPGMEFVNTPNDRK